MSIKWIAYSGDFSGRSVARFEYERHDAALMDQWNGLTWGLHPSNEKTHADEFWEKTNQQKPYSNTMPVHDAAQ